MNTYNIVYSDTLQHHGVKGMKWGVRKERVTAGLRKIGKGISNLANSPKGTQARKKISAYTTRKTNEWRETNQRKKSNSVTIAGGWALRLLGRKVAVGLSAAVMGTAIAALSLNSKNPDAYVMKGAKVAGNILNYGYKYATIKDTYNTVGRLSTHLSDKNKNNKNKK